MQSPVGLVMVVSCGLFGGSDGEQASLSLRIGIEQSPT